MLSIPENLRDLLDRPITCALATLMPDGQPQLTPVWCDYDGEYLLINSARGRQKDRNITTGAKVTVLFIDPQNDGHWLEVRGVVQTVTEDGALDQANHVARKYTGEAFRTLTPGEVRVIYRIEPLKVNGQ